MNERRAELRAKLIKGGGLILLSVGRTVKTNKK